jgi:hypothetical protein
VRHIPEEELHAYLDQALSRSQCVEIERHLTRCPRCRMTREDIASLRDRTTDLLALLGPATLVSPPFEQICRQTQRRHRRHRYRTAVLIAAGLTLAVLMQTQPVSPAPGAAAVAAARRLPPEKTGHSGVREAARSPETDQTARPTAARAPIAPAMQVRQTRLPDPKPETPTGQPATAVGTTPAGTLTAVTFENPSDDGSPDFPSLGEMAPIEAQPVERVPTPPGLWLTVASSDGSTAVPSDAARIPGLPVVSVRVQPGEPGGAVVAVDQLLENGEVVRTLSGPPERVHTALAGDGAFRDVPDASRLTLTIKQGDRMVAVTGPSEVLGQLLSASTVRRRY